MARCHSSALGAAVLVLLSSSVHAASGTASPAPPFTARLAVESARIRLDATSGAPPVGLLHFGDRVVVTGCVPDCRQPGAWALLGGAGALKLSLLSSDGGDRDFGPDLPPPERMLHGLVRGGGAAVYTRPDCQGARKRGVRAGRVLAFIPDDALLAGGWLRRVDGTYLRADRLRIDRPSTFAGELHPALPLAFAVRDTPIVGTGGALQTMTRYARLPVAGALPGGRLAVPGGAVRRDRVRVAALRPRPPGVAPGDKWVHVDLREQVLVAYEGDTPVLATLVSTGKRDARTRAGHFTVWFKTIHELMHGDEEPYWIEDVPFIQSFFRGQALHGAFWHDHFGQALTHGCVNLSMADARWLFEWSPPSLPAGWHAVLPGAAGRGVLHVRTQWAPPPVLPRVPAIPAATEPSTSEAPDPAAARVARTER